VRERSAARSFVLLLGVVSLLGDMTYEGGWSIVGPYMASLGASAAVVGIASGFGELVGYAVRLVSGVTVDRTRGYWPIAIFGYVVNMLSVPALALAGTWPVATALVVAERHRCGLGRSHQRSVPPRFAGEAGGRASSPVCTKCRRAAGRYDARGDEVRRTQTAARAADGLYHY
jgi:hypothetical protein